MQLGSGPAPEQHRATNLTPGTPSTSPSASMSATQQTVSVANRLPDAYNLPQTWPLHTPTNIPAALLALQTCIHELEALNTSLTNNAGGSQPQQPNKEDIECAKATADALAKDKEPTKPSIPDIVPGFKSDPLAFCKCFLPTSHFPELLSPVLFFTSNPIQIPLIFLICYSDHMLTLISSPTILSSYPLCSDSVYP